MIEWKTKRVGSTKNVNDFDAQQKLFFQLLLPFGNNGNKKEEEKERRIDGKRVRVKERKKIVRKSRFKLPGLLSTTHDFHL